MSSWVRSVLTSSLDVSAASRVLAVRSLLREVATEVASLLMCDAADPPLLMYDDGEPPVPVREEAASVSSEETTDAADTMDARRVPFVSVMGTTFFVSPAVGDSSPAASMFSLERWWIGRGGAAVIGPPPSPPQLLPLPLPSPSSTPTVLPGVVAACPACTCTFSRGEKKFEDISDSLADGALPSSSLPGLAVAPSNRSASRCACLAAGDWERARRSIVLRAFILACSSSAAVGEVEERYVGPIFHSSMVGCTVVVLVARRVGSPYFVA